MPAVYRALKLTAVYASILLIVCVCLAGDALACPTCKDGLAENDPSTQAMAAGYFYSILFMMSMPFLIIGTFGSFAYLSIRKARQAEALATASSLQEPKLTD